MGMLLKKHWDFALNTYRKRSPQGGEWDDKEDPTMHDEILEGNGHPCRLNVDLKAWAHTFVLHNVIALGP